MTVTVIVRSVSLGEGYSQMRLRNCPTPPHAYQQTCTVAAASKSCKGQVLLTPDLLEPAELVGLSGLSAMFARVGGVGY